MEFIKNTLKIIIFPIIFLFGYLYFLFTQKTLHLSYAAFRFLFVQTNGKINNLLSYLISLGYKPVKSNESGILGKLNESDIDSILKSIDHNGYYVFNQSLDDKDVEGLMKFALETKTKSIDITKKGVVYLPEKALFNSENPLSPRYQFEGLDVVQNDIVRKIVFDASLREIASRYLKCKPILDIVTMWWSVPFGNNATAQSAQMYHFDMDRFKFLKFFFYITDVQSSNGPHCYIEGSHKMLPKEILTDRRLTDEELLALYPKDKFIEFTGKKGSILAVDTRGLHKGKSLTDGKRLLFQIQFSNSLFGAEYENLSIFEKTSEEKNILNNHSKTYQLFN